MSRDGIHSGREREWGDSEPQSKPFVWRTVYQEGRINLSQLCLLFWERKKGCVLLLRQKWRVGVVRRGKSPFEWERFTFLSLIIEVCAKFGEHIVKVVIDPWWRAAYIQRRLLVRSRKITSLLLHLSITYRWKEPSSIGCCLLSPPELISCTCFTLK